MATINHERKRVITNVIRFREDSKRRPHDFNIGKLDETLGEKKSSGQGWPLVRKMGVPRKRIVNPRWCRVRRWMHQMNRVNPVFRARGVMALLADNESKAKIMMLVIGIFMGLIAGQLAWDRSEKHPDYVMPVGDRVTVVIKEYGKSAYIYTNRKDHFEFEAELRPNSPYYPMPEKEVMGHKAYPFNPKFNEWVEDWKKINKVD